MQRKTSTSILEVALFSALSLIVLPKKKWINLKCTMKCSQCSMFISTSNKLIENSIDARVVHCWKCYQFMKLNWKSSLGVIVLVCIDYWLLSESIWCKCTLYPTAGSCTRVLMLAMRTMFRFQLKFCCTSTRTTTVINA